jgi:hypothetical protein
VKYYFRGCGIGDFIGNPQGLTLQDYSESHHTFAGFSFMKFELIIEINE